jgi:multiple sugar transport system ATP-binding protein
MATISLRQLGKSYGAHSVLSGVDLEIDDRQFCVLVGPSGCGKSTLLRMIAGLEDVTSGSIMIDDEDVTASRPGERDLAMVFQSYALYPHKTVRDNLGFSLRMHAVDKDLASSRIESTAGTLGLSGLLDRFPGQLSGGQRQRVAMGRAMVRNPSVFLFDEPLSNLDAKLRVQMRVEIRELHDRIGATTVYVTHDQIEAMTMADRIIVMNGGVIEQAGPPLELFDDPDNIFVASFLGSPSINLIDATLEDNKNARLKDGTIIPLDGVAGTPKQQPVVLGARPHALRPAADGPIQAKVRVVESTGVETHVFAEFNGTDIVSQVARQDMPLPGNDIRFTIDPEAILVFDKASGRRLR